MSAPVNNNTTTAASEANTAHPVGQSEQQPGLIGGLKGRAAQAHGLGEALRGNFNTAVDQLAGDKQGEAKDMATREGGEAEMISHKFTRPGPDKAI